MTYKIWCRAKQDFFGEGKEFKTLEEVRQQLISYYVFSDEMDKGDIHYLYQMKLGELLDLYDGELYNKNNELKVVD